ncbi:MAG: DNA repair helicase XPB [bacterium]
MPIQISNPLIIQSDRSILLEVHNPLFEEARDALSRFADLVKSPEHIHTYKITPLSLWNAASAGMKKNEIFRYLDSYSKYPIPQNIMVDIEEILARYGKLVLFPADKKSLLRLEVSDPYLQQELSYSTKLQDFWVEKLKAGGFLISIKDRGNLKQALIKIGYPVDDRVGYIEGDALEIKLRSATCDGTSFSLRDYQQEAIATYYRQGSVKGGHGVIVLPCGSGKTVIGMGVMEKISAYTLIISTNTVAVHQWIDELLDKTSLTAGLIGEYTGNAKQIRPVTITTYQILTYRKSKEGEFLHMGLFQKNNWGLIIYDEVHTLPAPVFRATAEIQAKRRLGLTATLVREDGLEGDVFSLVGPKKYDVPWKELEERGFIAEAYCHEIRLELPHEDKLAYALADERQKFRIASENKKKIRVSEELITNHLHDQTLIIGQYISQLEELQKHLNIPMITGKTKNKEREILYQDFRQGKLKQLIVSKVANFAVDLPDANVAIQVSGTFGSRQEEAQRLGRILRPKHHPSYFYTLVSRDTKEQDFALKRQMFLAEQGYKYKIENW